jgi:AcrR family transcriptional regulator
MTSQTTRARIVDAMLATLAAEGFAGASARSIARTGGFNQALIFYHFGSIENLMVAAVQEFSERRLERYREALAPVGSVAELIGALAKLYEQDVTAGRVAAVQEIVAGASSSPELRHRVAELVDPWTAFAGEVVRRLVLGTALESLIPVEEAAYALVAMYFGVETLTHLDPDRSRASALFAQGFRLAPIFDAILRPREDRDA